MAGSRPLARVLLFVAVTAACAAGLAVAWRARSTFSAWRAAAGPDEFRALDVDLAVVEDEGHAAGLVLALPVAALALLAPGERRHRRILALIAVPLVASGVTFAVWAATRFDMHGDFALVGGVAGVIGGAVLAPIAFALSLQRALRAPPGDRARHVLHAALALAVMAWALLFAGAYLALGISA